MNYALFHGWLIDRTDELVAMGVPRLDAERMMASVECDAISCEARERSERQFLLDFRALGSKGVADKYGVSQQAVQKRRRKLLETLPPVVREVA